MIGNAVFSVPLSWFTKQMSQTLKWTFPLQLTTSQLPYSFTSKMQLRSPHVYPPLALSCQLLIWALSFSRVHKYTNGFLKQESTPLTTYSNWGAGLTFQFRETPQPNCIESFLISICSQPKKSGKIQNWESHQFDSVTPPVLSKSSTFRFFQELTQKGISEKNSFSPNPTMLSYSMNSRPAQLNGVKAILLTSR